MVLCGRLLTEGGRSTNRPVVICLPVDNSESSTSLAWEFRLIACSRIVKICRQESLGDIPADLLAEFLQKPSLYLLKPLKSTTGPPTSPPRPKRARGAKATIDLTKNTQIDKKAKESKERKVKNETAAGNKVTMKETEKVKEREREALGKAKELQREMEKEAAKERLEREVEQIREREREKEKEVEHAREREKEMEEEKQRDKQRLQELTEQIRVTEMESLKHEVQALRDEKKIRDEEIATLIKGKETLLHTIQDLRVQLEKHATLVSLDKERQRGAACVAENELLKQHVLFIVVFVCFDLIVPLLCL